MASTEEARQEIAPDPGWEPRLVLRAARHATLATVHAGQPFAALVTHACTPDLTLLMLLSGLSEHTRHLRADPRCALMAVGAPVETNPQTAPRVTVTGLAEPLDDPALKARFVRIHPYAALYANFADFALYRLRPMGALFVGGFARAHRLRAGALLPDPTAVAALQEAEPEIIAHCNEEHADALVAIARRAGGTGGAWSMVGCDVDGCDLAPAGPEQGTVLRIAWSRPAAEPGDVRSELIRLAREARA
jgi:putative heme iron utilization protein